MCPAPPTDPHWTAYLTALLTPTVAVLGSFIAYRQWRLAQNKLKLDLFDRRFSVYVCARDLLASIMTTGLAKDEEVFKYLVGTREAKWLLNEPIDVYLSKTLYHAAVDLQTMESELKNLSRGDERTRVVQKQAELKKWFQDQYAVLDTQFSPYLRLAH